MAIPGGPGAGERPGAGEAPGAGELPGPGERRGPGELPGAGELRHSRLSGHRAEEFTRAVPRSSYRWQINARFTLRDAAEQVPYLHRLGADWVYCSPLLQSEPGSDHGYDVIDHSRTDPDRGGRAGLAALADSAHTAGIGVLVDIVPNHVGIATPALSVWWWDVLSHGRDSAHAAAFDIDWDAGGGRLLLPVLGDGNGDPERELDALRIENGRLCYYEHAFPIAEGTGDGTPRQVHDRQHYRLVNFRRADTELNYRRFFAVTTLAGIRAELPDVFTSSHAEIAHWLQQGWVDGLRVDHPDGLADPAGYLTDLADLSDGRWTVVEKILEPGEHLPGWACAGTTGYDTLALVDRVLVDPDGREALVALDTRLRGHPCSWDDLTHRTKRAVADGILNSEIRRLARLVPTEAGSFPSVVDTIAEITACFPTYRSYLPEGREYLMEAVTHARRRRPDLAGVFDRLLPLAQDAGSEFATRLQQTTGAVMAKGVEDCAFYRYPLLTSLTEVGGDPSQFSVTPEEFHLAQAQRLTRWPDGMTTLSTHDTKRGEDVRARIDAISEVPGDWSSAVTGWLARTGFPDRVLGHLLLQTAVGAWPVERDRLHAYAEKAAREAGDSTGWIDPDPSFEPRLHELVDACYDDEVVAAGLAVFADRLRPFGWSNSLSAKLIQLTLPGVPDVYRGTELWENSLVDPDNRRPFDPGAPGGAADLLARLDGGWLPPLDRTGAAKLLVTSRALRARRDRADLFTGYRPVAATGAAAQHLVCFDRGGAITLATRLPVGLAAAGGWGDTRVELPAGSFVDAVTGREVAGGPAPESGSVTVRVADVLDRYPVTLLLRHR